MDQLRDPKLCQCSDGHIERETQRLGKSWKSLTIDFAPTGQIAGIEKAVLPATRSVLVVEEVALSA